MTERLYYHDSFLYDFEARVVEALDRNGRPAIVLPLSDDPRIGGSDRR